MFGTRRVVGKPFWRCLCAAGDTYPPILFFDGWGVQRYNPDNEALLRHIRLPVRQTTSCAFGGENLDELYVTSAVYGMDDEALQGQPMAGSLIKIDPGVRGVPAFSYGG